MSLQLNLTSTDNERREGVSMGGSGRAGRWPQAQSLMLILISRWWEESEKSLISQMFSSCCQKNIGRTRLKQRTQYDTEAIQYLKETHPSGTSFAYQLSLVARRSKVKEGRGNFVFQRWAENC